MFGIIKNVDKLGFSFYSVVIIQRTRLIFFFLKRLEFSDL